MHARFGYAIVNDDPTLLCGCGTMGLDTRRIYVSADLGGDYCHASAPLP
ncbi:MAG: hypothetical protein ACLP9L_37210 [Thermoguttaceae bacterium]